jgi:hypothetical protein
MQLSCAGIKKPDAAPLRPDEIASHVCVQLEQGIGILLLTYAGRVAENHS